MLSGIVTLVLLVLFLIGWVWAWRPARKRDFDAAAQLPLHDDDKSLDDEFADDEGRAS